MIPKYFRCGDPSHKCPLSVSKELLKEDPKWVCPCQNSNCVDFREPVSFYAVHKLWFWGAGAVGILLLLLVLFAGKDPCVPKLDDFQARFSKLDKDAAALVSSQKSDANPEVKLSRDVAVLESETQKLGQTANQAISSSNRVEVQRLIAETKQRIEAAKVLSQSLVKPESGSGVMAAQAKSLIGKMISLQQEIEEQHEIAENTCPKHVDEFEAMTENVAASISKLRRMNSGGVASSPVDSNLITSAKKSISELESIHQRLSSLPAPEPPPIKIEPPFADADLVIGAAPGIAERLVAPLAASWTTSKVVSGPDDEMLYVDGGAGKKFIVKPMDSTKGFESLAAGEVALFFADRSPTAAELTRFGAGFKESRSVAEVVALDALTLLVHPDNPIETYEIGQEMSLTAAAGPLGSAVRSRAEQFGLRSSAVSDSMGEEAAMQDRKILACGLYHLEGQNLRAKRLAVKASKESAALKPSPFTIATEEYLYSYRIVAWSPIKASETALSFVKFITSNAGQATVEQCGFVDLRLRPVPGNIDPAILAALATALGVDAINAAQRLSTNIRFAVGDSQLDLKAQADIERITREAALNFPAHKVVILGFTDSDGGPAINQPLSIKRAESLAAELRKFKVDTRAGGLGSSFPIDTNETEAGKARNRRAEVWMVKP